MTPQAKCSSLPSDGTHAASTPGGCGRTCPAPSRSGGRSRCAATTRPSPSVTTIAPVAGRTGTGWRRISSIAEPGPSVTKPGSVASSRTLSARADAPAGTTWTGTRATASSHNRPPSSASSRPARMSSTKVPPASLTGGEYARRAPTRQRRRLSFCVVVTCSACLTQATEGSRFCPSCGSPLGQLAAPADAVPPDEPIEERRIISALFCDLVGFTAISESADPEDIDRMLTRYFAMARAAIEAHGGVVEKFIGDAVLGVFGVPAAHEDDPLRAIRAGLRIVDGAAGLRTLAGAPLRLRVGINTGEVLARLDVAPDSGQRFLAGDTVKTAARIQSVAPEMGVAVGESTWQATRPAVDWVELPPATHKGKAQPVQVFQAIALRTTAGLHPSRVHGGAYVGRARELARLRDAFDRVVVTGRTGLAMVVGEPGIGKSRIVGELRIHAQDAGQSVVWRQGRCLPYGDGVSFWALGEIVKSHAGILEGDDPESTRAKLDATLAESPEQSWLRSRLLPLVGIDGGAAAGREEAFAAWRSFLIGLAAAGPAVVVIEDLHWADDAFLAFVATLAATSDFLPLFVLGTTRPEL